MNKCTIIIHQGYGDLFNSIGIINYYSTIYDNITILLIDNSHIYIMEEIFKHKNNINFKIPNYINSLDDVYDTCIMCMTKSTNNRTCPRSGKEKCKLIDYNKYGENIIRIGSFQHFENWINELNKSKSFAHAFYSYQNLNQNIRFNFFKLYNDKTKENYIYKNFVNKYGKKYILIHEDINRNIRINKNKITQNIPIINLDNISVYFVDYLKVIINASEIHLIDSSWSVFIYLLTYTKCKNIPIYLNETDTIKRGRSTNIYKNPTFNNWIFY